MIVVLLHGCLMPHRRQFNGIVTHRRGCVAYVADQHPMLVGDLSRVPVDTRRACTGWSYCLRVSANGWNSIDGGLEPTYKRAKKKLLLTMKKLLREVAQHER